MHNKVGWAVASLVLMCISSVALGDDSKSSSGNQPEQSQTIISRDAVAQEGDTLATLARRELGKSAFASLLADYNNVAVDTNLVAGAIISIPIHVPSRGEFAEVVFVKGSVTATRQIYIAPQTSFSVSASQNTMSVSMPGLDTEVIELARGDKIFTGDVIATSSDGYISVVFSSGSVINLQPETIASLDKLVCLETDDTCQIDIDTRQGRVTSRVESRDEQPVNFRVTTPYASAAVRGTVFDVNASDKLLVGVTEGKVDVSALNETVPLDTGFGLSVAEGEAPGEPVELIPAPVFRRVPARFAAGDTLEWWPFADASSYLALISEDESASRALVDFEVPEGNSELDLAGTLDQSIEPGDYFITIRAVDRDGLLGFPSNTRITLANIDPSLDPVSTRVVSEGSEFLVTVDGGPENALGYEIQISNDEAFSDPLSVDVNQNGTAIFRIDEDQVFSRARVLIDPYTVSAFGEASSN